MDSARFRARLSSVVRQRRLSLQDHRLLCPRVGPRHPLGRSTDRGAVAARRRARAVRQGRGAAAAEGCRGVCMSRPRILLTGARGQVGWELQRTLSCLGEVVALDSKAMNLADPDAVRRTVREIAPAIIVNPAAFTAVDKAESEAELAHAVNATAPGVLGEEAVRLGALLVHYSTDYVFDGSGTTPWRAEDACDPL